MFYSVIGKVREYIDVKLGEVKQENQLLFSMTLMSWTRSRALLLRDLQGDLIGNLPDFMIRSS